MCGNGGLCVERRMPASSGDPVSTALHMSLAGNKCPTLKNDDLDTKIVASARRVLLTEIQYEPAGSYSNTVLDSLKSKYIVLNPNNCDSKVEIKVKNGSKESSSPSKENSNSSNSSPKKVKLSDVTLPTPKRILYPPEAIQLGWQGSTPVGSGMVNMGNTCYLNSTLQALFHVPAFVNWILNDKIHSSKCGMINGAGHTECLICAVMKTLEFTHRFSGSPIKPLQIYSKLKFICKHLVHGHQEDAHEFLRYLIESMERSYLTIVVQGTKLDNYSKETTPLNQIFGGYLRTEVTCLECRHVSTTFQHFQDLLLDIRTVGSVEDALEAYFGREQLGEGEEAYRCEQCHRRVAATKKFSIQKAPNVLCMQLKRFGILGGKISKHVSLKQKLDLSKFMHPSSSSNNELKYRLVSMISHIGPSASCGHYTAMAAASNGLFYLFDDSTVRQVQLQTVLSTNAYVIMYELEPPASVQRPPKPIPSFTINSSNGLNGKNLQNGVAVTHSSPISVHKQSLVLSPSKSERAAALSSTSPSTSTSTSSSTSLTSSSPQSNSNTASSPLKQSKLVNGLSSNASKSLVPYTPGESSDSESENATGYHRSTKQLNNVQSKTSSAISTVNGVTKEVTQKSQLLFSPSKTNSVKTEPASPAVHKLNFIPSSVLSSLSKNNGSVIKKENTGNQSAVMNQLTLKKLNDDSPPTLTSSNIWLVSDATSLNSPNSSAGSSSGTSIGCGAVQWCVTEISKSRSNEKSETITTESKLCSDTSETPTTGDLNNSSSNNNNNNNNNNLNCSNNSNNSNSSSSCSSVSSLSGNSSSHDWSSSVMNGSNNKNNSCNNNCSNGNNSNSKMWDGCRNNDTVNELLKFSHRGYGSSNVNSWNGGKSEVDKEVENEKHEQRKRSHHNDYDSELDRGKVKKLKSNNFYSPSNSCNGRRHNPFQDHQNRKNSWHGNNNGMNNKRHLFHRSYNNIDRYRNSNHRSYHSQNGYSNRWRSH